MELNRGLFVERPCAIDGSNAELGSDEHGLPYETAKMALMTPDTALDEQVASGEEPLSQGQSEEGSPDAVGAERRRGSGLLEVTAGLLVAASVMFATETPEQKAAREQAERERREEKNRISKERADREARVRSETARKAANARWRRQGKGG